MRKHSLIPTLLSFAAIAASSGWAAPVAFWQFNEKVPGMQADAAPGEFLDETGNYPASLVATASALPYYAEGNPDYDGGSALAFDAAGAIGLTVPDAPALNLFSGGAEATIEAMIKTTATDFGYLVSKQDWGTSGYWYLRMQPNGQLFFESVDTLYPDAGNTVVSAHGLTPINDGQWHHVAAVIDTDTSTGSASISLYVDYAIDTAGVAGSPTGLGNLDNVGNLYIGTRADGGQLLTGDIDFVRISDTALAPSEMIGYTDPGPVEPNVYRHVGRTDPTTEGFLNDGSAGSPITDDLGVDAWNIAGGFARYRTPLAVTDLAAMDESGWSAALEVRNNLIPDDASDYGVHIEVSDLAYTYFILFGQDDAGLPTAQQITSVTALTKAEIPISGVSGSGHHAYELKQAAGLPGSVDFYIDGVFQATLAGTENDSYPAYKGRFVWGATDGGATANANYSLVELVIGTAEEPLAGDLNGDGFVGSADLDIVRGNWGEDVPAGCLSCGDPSGDGFVGSADLDIVRANWGATAAAAVPEPASLVLVLAAVVCLLGFRRQLR